MDYLVLTGLIILTIIIISVIVSVYLQDYDNKYKSAWASAFSRTFSSIAGVASFTFIVGIIVVYFPQYRKWPKFSNPAYLE